ncbi:MAG TPA: 4-hydroxybenzoate 3-monooxygenase [Acidimicrobiia bacterium]|nr:4-hydroxybenzoate 3-monooxygenase [Acidimicrobiia bacterium]
MSETPKQTRVLIIGGGPAGSLLALLLHQREVESVILELRTREHVLERVRAGVIEHGSAEVLRAAGVAGRMDSEGFVHEGVQVAHGEEMIRIDFEGLTGKHVTIYGQTELQRDLYGALDSAGIPLLDEAEGVRVEGIEGDSPMVTFERDGATEQIRCDFVAGCDGAHGVSNGFIPPSLQRTFERTYPFCWVGLLSETPPISDELIYARHERGFALCSMRSESRSRYYVQGSADTTLAEWPDDRFWSELAARLPKTSVASLVTGPSIEKIVTPLRSWVSEPLRHGRLLLAGDTAHVVPPTGAKGLNLAISDVVYLSDALAWFYRAGSTTGLEGYSDRALARVWKAVRFSWWMTNMLHLFPGMSDDFERRLQTTELDYLFGSDNAQRAMAENYVGLPL